MHDPSLGIPTPDVPGHLLWIWRAYHRLDLDRNWIGGGMGAPIPGRISWRAVVEWADYHEYDADDRDMLDQCIIAMDSAYIKHHNKRRAG